MAAVCCCITEEWPYNTRSTKGHQWRLLYNHSKLNCWPILASKVHFCFVLRVAHRFFEIGVSTFERTPHNYRVNIQQWQRPLYFVLPKLACETRSIALIKDNPCRFIMSAEVEGKSTTNSSCASCGASQKAILSNWRNAPLVVSFNIAALNAKGSTDQHISERANNGRLSYMMRFYSGSQRATISGTARSVTCRYRLMKINLLWWSVAAKWFVRDAVMPVRSERLNKIWLLSVRSVDGRIRNHLLKLTIGKLTEQRGTIQLLCAKKVTPPSSQEVTRAPLSIDPRLLNWAKSHHILN